MLKVKRYLKITIGGESMFCRIIRLVRVIETSNFEKIEYKEIVKYEQ